MHATSQRRLCERAAFLDQIEERAGSLRHGGATSARGRKRRTALHIALACAARRRPKRAARRLRGVTIDGALKKSKCKHKHVAGTAFGARPGVAQKAPYGKRWGEGEGGEREREGRNRKESGSCRQRGSTAYHLRCHRHQRANDAELAPARRRSTAESSSMPMKCMGCALRITHAGIGTAR